MSIVSNDIYQKIPDVARPTLTSTNQEVLAASGDKLKILGRGNLLLRRDDTKDAGISCTNHSRRKNRFGLLVIKSWFNRFTEYYVRGRWEASKSQVCRSGKLGCFRVVAHDKVVMPAQSEMIIRGAVDDSANKLTYETIC